MTLFIKCQARKLEEKLQVALECLLADEDDHVRRASAITLYSIDRQRPLDVASKLSDLMWNDWSTAVRHAASQTLGRLGEGRHVHNNLLHLLQAGNETARAEVLEKIGRIGVMTAKLLPSFLRCFQSEFVSVRVRACEAAARLLSREPRIVAELLELAMYDGSWRAKAHAIKALGELGDPSPDIRDCLLWALRFESAAGVRAEACHALVQLQITDPEVIKVMLDRLWLESNEVVESEIKMALAQQQVNVAGATQSTSMLESADIKKLCEPHAIAAQILASQEQEKAKAKASAARKNARVVDAGKMLESAAE
ncbi:PREDICTED: HEAT repeat-containing protein 4-like [Priapulus caudatus]|uniref:HEAT repeat-containing protein 4-like n=1 Tax=Priapulus caudatus TaxID=37621 RepID=A0ABM1E908_PRICU|nr:PREDICTED: HEAT repeat-containing protein 4-like [Priapulus caudatus]